MGEARTFPRDIGEGRVIALYPEQDAVDEDTLVAFWTAHAGLSDDEARRRVAEVLLVVTAADGGVVGITTAYLQHSAQLRTAMWHQRAFVAASVRRTDVGTHLASDGIHVLERRFVTGEDTRAPGVLWEIEHPGLKRADVAHWWWSDDLWWIGENARGDHLRVHWFPGAHAPPFQGST